MFNIGGSASKSSGTSNTQTNSTTTPNVPDWLQSQVQGQSQSISALAGANPQSYVPGASALQQAGAATATPLASSYVPTATSAVQGLDLGVAGSAAPTVRSQSAAAGVDKWMNPFTQDVVNTSAADFDHNAAIQHAQRTLDAANSGAFGGSGAAIAQSEGDDASNRARATLLSGLRNTAFDTAASNSQQDAARAQAASSQNATMAQNQEGLQLQAGQNIVNNATGADANSRANVSSLFAAGDDQRNVQQQQAQAPLDLQAWANSQFGTLPAGMFVGSTTNGTSNNQTTGTSLGLKGSVAGPVPL
jgi:hypothetical protein